MSIYHRNPDQHVIDSSPRSIRCWTRSSAILIHAPGIRTVPQRPKVGRRENRALVGMGPAPDRSNRIVISDRDEGRRGLRS